MDFFLQPLALPYAKRLNYVLRFYGSIYFFSSDNLFMQSQASLMVSTSLSIKSPLCQLGFDLNAVKSAWVKRGYLIKYKDKFRYPKRISDAIISCTCIVLPDVTQCYPEG